MSRGLPIRRNEVLVVVPPNSNTVIDGQLLTVTRPEEHSDWSDFLSLGALSMVCELGEGTDLRPIYVDGTVIELDDILSYITENGARILAVCVGALTANYEAGLLIMRHAKQVDDRIATVIGNDHFTALSTACMRADCIDFGFRGNEVVGSFGAAIRDLHEGRSIAGREYAGLVTRTPDGVRMTPQTNEPVYDRYEYARIDSVFNHTQKYADQFATRVAPRVRELVGRDVSAGVPIEIGRGCVKFATHDACSFCSIQYGGMWKNQLTPELAWETIERAWRGGYDYMYITADELPLTFGPLLTAMSATKPAWWKRLPPDERPMLVGYARADGVASERRTRLLMDLGIRQVMIGMDAGSAASLAAMNKPLGGGRDDFRARSERLYEQNWDAVRVARENGLLIRAGFVLGNIGLTREALQENVERITALIGAGRDVIAAVDAEVLQPTPGSFDWTYLTSPTAAHAAADRLGLEIADDAELERAASAWRDCDIVLPEVALRDYITALMPDVSFEEVAAARATIRACAKDNGIVIGE